ncbi:hydrogen gas-evolving membrane-bound hydrogenase subunit E [Olivibacter sitiensis]|uniref:hydrogen gas-evolving membrane-bound hydrogenase subunit E n=1 Tax=Olivibacter sitiensis TaxID=376470 RepID=UPI0004842AA6|nr:hydrogen gas-evolving membrane-bound hydrogenase subunit E [Olivibacter sitiensis]
MALALLILFLLSFVSLAFSEKKAYRWAFVMAGICICVFVYFCRFIPVVSTGETWVQHISWVPQIHFNLNFYLDALSLFFVLLISFFGICIFAYAGVYMRAQQHQNRFFFYLGLFMSSMIGLVMADNVFLLYVFWELTSISSYFLISYDSEKKAARRAGMQALLLTNLGGLALLAALVLLGQQIGSYELSVMLDHKFQSGNYYLPILLLLCLACFTKSAQFPFHFWLPNAMAAPTPVSAFLHSATMVKAGVFLLLRFHPVLGGTVYWEGLLISMGGITALLGAMQSLTQNDMKKLLAYITVSTLGILVMAIGVGSVTAIQAALLYLLAHALYKGALFMLAGNVDKQIKSKNVDELTGLFQVMPYSGVALILACAAMAGFPPLLAFLAKEKLYEMGVSHGLGSFALWAVFLSSAVYVTISLKLVYGMFLSQRKQRLGEKGKEVSFLMWAAPLVLSVLGIGFGIFAYLIAPFMEQVCNVVIGRPYPLDTAMWHGFNLPFVLSLATWGLGALLYVGLRQIRKIFGSSLVTWWDFDGWYDKSLLTLQYAARKLTVFVQGGKLTVYLKTTFFLVTALLVFIYIDYDLYPSQWLFRTELKVDRIYEFLPLMMIVVGVVTVMFEKSRLTMLAALSLVGYGIALFYAMFSAPDVSMTQFLVETITLLIFVIVLHRLPKHISFPREHKRIVSVLIALAFGTITTLILASMQGYEMHGDMKEFYITKAGPEGKGENVVNVMLVDFRAFDTFGEMVVLCMTALGVMTLIKLKSNKV